MTSGWGRKGKRYIWSLEGDLKTPLERTWWCLCRSADYASGKGTREQRKAEEQFSYTGSEGEAQGRDCTGPTQETKWVIRLERSSPNCCTRLASTRSSELGIIQQHLVWLWHWYEQAGQHHSIIKHCLNGAMLLKPECANNSPEDLVKLLIQFSGIELWDPNSTFQMLSGDAGDVSPATSR